MERVYTRRAEPMGYQLQSFGATNRILLGMLQWHPRIHPHPTEFWVYLVDMGQVLGILL
jgi:hypothetical protein